MKKAIAYYRVSTDKQGETGLGMQAQKAAIDKFLNNGELFLTHEESILLGDF